MELLSRGELDCLEKRRGRPVAESVRLDGYFTEGITQGGRHSGKHKTNTLHNLPRDAARCDRDGAEQHTGRQACKCGLGLFLRYTGPDLLPLGVLTSRANQGGTDIASQSPVPLRMRHRMGHRGMEEPSKAV